MISPTAPMRILGDDRICAGGKVGVDLGQFLGRALRVVGHYDRRAGTDLQLPGRSPA
jgi:hypothetical protein